MSPPGLFDFIWGYTLDAGDLPDGAWMAFHDEAVQAYNKLCGTDHDWFDIQIDYFDWKEKEGLMK